MNKTNCFQKRDLPAQIKLRLKSDPPEIPTVTSQEALPASLEAWQLYLPLSANRLLLMHRTATLLLKLMSYLSELKISVLSLNQLTDMGCDPDTLPSIFTSLPSVSSMCSEGFLVNTGGFLRSKSQEIEKRFFHKETPSNGAGGLKKRLGLKYL